MTLVTELRKPSAFLKSAVVLVLLSLCISPLRHTPAYVKAFDLVVLAFDVLLLAWSVFLWRTKRDEMKGKGLFSRELRFVGLLFTMAPFIFTFMEVIGDFVARELPFYESSIGQMRSSQATQVLGDRITIGWPIDLVGEASSDSGHVDISIPVASPTKKADLHVSGVKANGVWSVAELYLVETGTNKQIPIEPLSILPAR